MSYTYLATSASDGEPVVAFPRKHELARWCRRQELDGFPDGGWLSLYRIRSTFYTDNSVVELVYRDSDLFEKDS